MTNPIADTLRAAKALIDTPEKWTQDAYRRDAKGEICGQEHAARWCAAASMLAVSRDDALRERAKNAFADAITRRLSIEAWNDAPERTHAEVMDAFDRAIAAAEAE